MNDKKKKNLSPEQLQRKYHQNLVFNYAEYPTCDHWSYEFNGDDYKKSLVDWLTKNPNKKITFYVHIPFCEQLCWFCTCSKVITQDYTKVKDYLNPDLFNEVKIVSIDEFINSLK